LLDPAAAQRRIQILDHREGHRFPISHSDGDVRDLIGEHSGQPRLQSKNQRGQEDDHDDAGGHGAHRQQRLAAAGQQMPQGKRRSEPPLPRQPRQCFHAPCLRPRTVCPAVTPVGSTTTSSLSVTPLATGIPWSTAGRVDTVRSTAIPSSTIITIDRVPCRRTAVEGTISRSAFSFVIRLTFTVCPGRSQSGGASGVIFTVTMPRAWFTAAPMSVSRPSKLGPPVTDELSTALWPSSSSARLPSSRSTRISRLSLTRSTTPRAP